MHLFHWHNMTEACKKGPLITPAPPLRRCPSQTAHGPFQTAPAIYCDRPTIFHRIRDEGHTLDLHPHVHVVLH